MSIIITGATGGLGRKTLEFLSKFSTPDSPQIIGTTRDLSRAPDISGVSFRTGDFNTPSTLDIAFKGASKVLIVSTDSFDNDLRLIQHKAAIDACVRAGVGRVYYTSLGLNGKLEKSQSDLQNTHLETEKMVKESGLPYTIIREGVYTEAFPLFLSWNPDTTSIILPGDGVVPFTSRFELAEGTARLLLSDDTKYVNSTVLLTGPSTIKFSKIADLIREVQHDGKESALKLELLSEEEYISRLVATGERTEGFARSWTSTLKALATGEADYIDGALEELLGRRPKAPEEYIKGLLKEGKETGGYRWHQTERLKATGK